MTPEEAQEMFKMFKKLVECLEAYHRIESSLEDINSLLEDRNHYDTKDINELVKRLDDIESTLRGRP